MSIRFISVLAATVVIAGCASMGQDFDMAEVDRLQPGVTTLSKPKKSWASHKALPLPLMAA